MAINQQNNVLLLLEKYWKVSSIVFGIVVGIFSAGYTLGSYLTKMESKFEKMNYDSECDKKVQAEKDKLNEYKQEREHEVTQNLVKFVDGYKAKERRSDEK